VLLEAMALGTPSVATPVTGIPELVRDGETGLIVGERNAAQLAEALDHLISNSAQRVSLATAARALIESAFDARTNAGQLRDGFRAAAKRNVPIPQEVA
jgi:glycosyltransferase involved in cell wall biosynthesis